MHQDSADLGCHDAQGSLSASNVQVDPLMAQRMATWVVWATINAHRKMDEYSCAQRKKEWPRLPVPDNKGISILVLGSGVMGGAAATALHQLGNFKHMPFVL
jgi:phosphoglycerate dehydrogenase-like enzyme